MMDYKLLVIKRKKCFVCVRLAFYDLSFLDLCFIAV